MSVFVVKPTQFVESPVIEDTVIQYCIINNFRNGYVREVKGEIVEFCSILSLTLSWFDRQPYGERSKVWRVNYDKKNVIYTAFVTCAKV